MENLIQLQSQLQKLPDQALSRYMHQPSQQVPQFMVMMEMQRRMQTRQQAAPQQPVPQTTVAQDLEGASAGLGALDMQAPQGFAEGGIVGYASGGMIPYDTGNSIEEWADMIKRSRATPDAPSEPAPIWQLLKNVDGYIGRTQQGMPNPDAAIGRSQQGMLDSIFGRKTTATPGFNPNAGQPPLSMVPPDSPMPAMPAASDGGGNDVNRLAILKREWTAAMMAGDTAKADSLQREIDEVTSGRAGDMNTGVPGSPAAGARSGVMKASAPAGGLGSVMARAPAAGLQQPLEVPPAPERPTAPSNYSVDDVLAMQERLRSQLPDNFPQAREIADAMAARAAKRRDDAGKDSLFEMGAALASSKNLNLGGAMGEAGLAMLKSRRGLEKEADNDQDKADDTRIKVLQAERLAAAGDMKAAADIMNTIHDNDARRYQTDANIYSADQHARTGIFNANTGMEKAALQAQIQQAVAEGRLSQMQAQLMLKELEFSNKQQGAELAVRKQDETERKNVFDKLAQARLKYMEILSKSPTGMMGDPAELRRKAEEMATADLTDEELARIGRQRSSGGGGGTTLKIGPNGQWVK